MGRHLNTAEVLRWNPDWTSRDRETVRAALDALPEPHLESPPSNAYAAAWLWLPTATHRDGWHRYDGNDAWVRVLVVDKGTIEWRREDYFPDLRNPLFAQAQEREDYPYNGWVTSVLWLALSTYRGRRASNTSPQGPRLSNVCHRCHLQMLPSGRCDNCE